MGVFMSCCRTGSTDIIPTPDMETRRRQQAEAAEARIRTQEYRGIKDPERVKRMQKKAEELEKQERMGGGNTGGGLKWQMD